MRVWSALPTPPVCQDLAIQPGRSRSQFQPGQLSVQPVIVDAELDAQPPPRPASDDIPVLQVLVERWEAELGQACLAALLDRLRLRGWTDRGRADDMLPPGRRRPADLVLVQQVAQRGGRDAELALNPAPGSTPG
jgi:hypothetical protein